jgi:hypothetical protein
MQIRQQVVDLLLAEDLGVAGHFVAAETNDVGDAVVVGGHPAHWQIFSLEDAFHAGALPSSRRVGRVAAVAIVVVDPAAGDLLRTESEFGVALAAFDLAASERQETGHRDTETQSKPFRILSFGVSIDRNAISLHLSFKGKNEPLQ